MLHAYDTGEEAITVNREGSIETKKLSKGLDDISSNSHGSDEDGWVEVVEVPDSPLQDDTNNSLSKKIDRNTGGNIQVCYEATAEISDASPCISLTLRLLSLQTKEHVHIEEIYIFAVPVESTDSDHRINPMDNSTGSSLLTMLVPTLLQLSRAGNNRMQDRRVSEIREEQKYQDGGSNATELTSPEMGRCKMQQKYQDDGSNATELTSPEMGMSKIQQETQSSTTYPMQERMQERSSVLSESVTIENNLSSSRVERVLDELVCRVGRIETFCSRFEENMLNPLACMATKLQQLEQKLDALTAVSGPSKLNTCSRFAAPEFSNDESESSSLYNDINKGYEASESMMKDDTSFNKISSPCFDDASDLDLSPPELFTGLVVTAPEFLNVDNEDDNNCNDASESEEKGCPVDKPVLSIDDALASALAGFLSSTSAQPAERSRTLIFKAPDFSNEEDEGDTDGELASPSGHSPCRAAENPAINLLEYNETDNMKDSDLTSCIPSQGSEVQVQHHTKWPNDSSTKATVEEIIPHKQFHVEVIDESMNSSYDETVPETPLLTECTDDTNTDTVEIEQNDNGSSVAIAKETTSAVINEGCEEDGSINKIRESFISAVDFELPILDVTFVSQTNMKTCSPLEALLSGILDTQTETTDDESDCDDIAQEQKDPTVSDQFLMLEDLVVKEVPVGLEGEELQDPYVTNSNQEPFSSLL